MPSKPINEDRLLNDGEGRVLQSPMCSQPWWHGVGNNPSFHASTLKPSSMDHLTDSSEEGNKSNDNNGNGVRSDEGGNNGQALATQVSTLIPTAAGHLEPNSKMELVGHSIALTSYPFSDLQYGTMFTTYGPQVMVPQLYGMHHTRMPLPLEMEEEPVFVNAKQFHGIMRRRQARAKAEIEKKVVKPRKPYLHESRHQHAMKRARGCGGRFLGKKLDSNASNGSRGSDSLQSGPERRDCMVQGVEAHTLSGANCGNHRDGSYSGRHTWDRGVQSSDPN